jgi:hypothetical protein
VGNQYLVASVIQDKGIGPRISQGPFKNRTGFEVNPYERSHGSAEAICHADAGRVRPGAL